MPRSPIAAHLAHLIVAAGCLLAVAVSPAAAAAGVRAPLALALAWLVGSNLVGNGVLGVSPYGSVFALARLQADGPAADYIHSVCPAARLRLCAWSGRLPMDSDAFLWAPDGPVWAHDSGPIPFAPEAARLVAAIVRDAPVAVAEHMRGQHAAPARPGAGRRHARAGLPGCHGRAAAADVFPVGGAALVPVRAAGAGPLAALAAPLTPLRLGLLAAGAVGTVLLVPWAWRRRPALAGLALTVLLGVLANAFATGALSGPHDRYGARIAWLLLLAPGFAALNAWQARRVTA